MFCSIILTDLRKLYVPVAQLDRALACGAKGRRFESRRVHQIDIFTKRCYCKRMRFLTPSELGGLDAYWDLVHPSLSHDYTVTAGAFAATQGDIIRLPDRIEAECGEIADLIAEELGKTGLSPYILEFFSPSSQFLLPSLSGCGVEWLVHYVCLDGDTVYDPILPRPTAYGEYVQRVFGQQEVAFNVEDKSSLSFV